MKYTLETDFSKHVKSDELHRVYLLYGSQTYLVSMYEKMLIKKALSGEFNEFNLHRFEGADFSMQDLYDAVEQLPFMAQARCVTVDIDPDKLDSGALKEFCSVISDPPATTTVIVTIKTGQPPLKKEKLSALVKTCDKAGGVIELGARRSADLLRFLRSRASKNGCELSSDEASYLVERCADDMQLLSQELDKVCAYKGTGTITKEEIDAVVSVVMQARVFDLSKAIFRGNFQKAMELVDQLLYMREPVPRILAVLSGSFVDLYRGFCARQAGVSPAQAAVDLGYAKNREFVLKNAMTDSAEYSAIQIGQMLETLIQADARLKSTGASDRVILEQVITQLFLITGKVR
ncbi:DNA polymerase III subunit delta [Youxingia wuxianensis]|uniref:DNA polymerase III subunit delta n=1 Tax=Youxingia wuxianensis TaxID=2763678 RepID=A0A926EMW2_9FIRM|nr:DNA polymerase III subunit delta [Youxingia wuxianensis]MBC8584601.1 DNA polymerase III subunit delta [Youxingia wuxianensis]